LEYQIEKQPLEYKVNKAGVYFEKDLNQAKYYFRINIISRQEEKSEEESDVLACVNVSSKARASE